MRAACAAGMRPIGVLAGAAVDEAALREAGAASVLRDARRARAARLPDAARGVPAQARLRRDAGAGARRRWSSAAGGSPCSAIAPRPSTTTSASRSTACWSAGPCRRARRWTRPSAGWRCAPRTTRSSTSHFEGVIPERQYGARRRDRLGLGHLGAGARDAGPVQGAAQGRDQVRPARRAARAAATRSCAPTRDDGRERWLLLKKRDEFAVDGWDAEDHPTSVKTGRTNDEVPRRRAAGLRGRAAAAAGRDRPVRGARRADARLHPADEGDAGRRCPSPTPTGCSRSSGTATGSRPWCATARRGSGRAATWTRRATSPISPARDRLDRGRRGDRRRRGRGARRARAGRGSACSRTTPASAPGARPARKRHGAAGARSSTRPSTCSTSTAARCSTCRSRSASGCSAPPPRRIRWSGTPATSTTEGGRFFDAARQQELEGIVAKLRRSPYEPDRRPQGVAEAQGAPGAGGRGRRLAARGRGRHRTSARSSWPSAAVIDGCTPARSAAASTRAPGASCARTLEELERRTRRWIRRRGSGRALGRAEHRHPRRVRRVDRGRAAAPGRLQGPRAGQGSARRSAASVRPISSREGRRPRRSVPTLRARWPRPDDAARRPRRARARGHLGRRRPRDPGHEPRQGAVSAPATGGSRSPSATCSATTSPIAPTLVPYLARPTA